MNSKIVVLYVVASGNGKWNINQLSSKVYRKPEWKIIHLPMTYIQGSKGIKQWPINLFTSPIMLHKILYKIIRGGNVWTQKKN